MTDHDDEIIRTIRARLTDPPPSAARPKAADLPAPAEAIQEGIARLAALQDRISDTPRVRVLLHRIVEDIEDLENGVGA